MNFNNVVGQEIVTRQLMNDIKFNRVNHSYIFDGPDGLGKNFIASIFIQTLICESHDVIACESCPACVKFKTNNNPDIKVLANTKKSIGVEEIREFFSDVTIRPFIGDRKIYLIKDAHTMTIQAQNAVLKTVEEPPAYVVIIFISENIEKILPTIKSRSKLLKFNTYSDLQIDEILQLKDADDFIIRYSEGVLGRARRLLEDQQFMSMREQVFDIAEKIVKLKSYASSYELEDGLSNNIQNNPEILDMLMYIFCDILKFKSINNFIINSDKINNIKSMSKQLSYQRTIKIIKALKCIKTDLNYNVNTSLAIDKMIIDMI